MAAFIDSTTPLVDRSRCLHASRFCTFGGRGHKRTSWVPSVDPSAPQFRTPMEICPCVLLAASAVDNGRTIPVLRSGETIIAHSLLSLERLTKELTERLTDPIHVDLLAPLYGVAADLADAINHHEDRCTTRLALLSCAESPHALFSRVGAQLAAAFSRLEATAPTTNISEHWSLVVFHEQPPTRRTLNRFTQALHAPLRDLSTENVLLASCRGTHLLFGMPWRAARYAESLSTDPNPRAVAETFNVLISEDSSYDHSEEGTTGFDRTFRTLVEMARALV